MAVVGFGVEFCVLNVIVNEAYNIFQSFGVMTHIGNFYIRNCATGRNLLELAFECKFLESVDIFTNINVVGVGVVTFIGNVGNATEFFFVDTSEAVAQTFCRSTVESKTNVGLCFPFIASATQTLHYAYCEVFAFRFGVAAAFNCHSNFVQANVTQGNGGVTTIEEMFNGFAFAQTSNCAILPMHRAYITTNFFQRFMTAHQSFVAKLQTFIQEFPEFLFVLTGNQTDLRKVNGNNALVKATFKLVFAFFVFPGSQEAAATHGREYVTFVVFTHFLSADIVRIHTFCTAFYCQMGNVIVFATFQAVKLVEYINQFGERRGNIYALVVFDALQTLTQNFFYDHCSFFQIRVVFFQM